MTQSFYSRYALRDGAPREAWRAERVEGVWVFKRQARQGDVEPWLTRQVASEPRIGNDWLAWDLTTLARKCQEMGISLAEGLELHVPHRNEGELHWHQSFGFCTRQ